MMLSIILPFILIIILALILKILYNIFCGCEKGHRNRRRRNIQLTFYQQGGSIVVSPEFNALKTCVEMGDKCKSIVKTGDKTWEASTNGPNEFFIPGQKKQTYLLKKQITDENINASSVLIDTLVGVPYNDLWYESFSAAQQSVGGSSGEDLFICYSPLEEINNEKVIPANSYTVRKNVIGEKEYKNFTFVKKSGNSISTYIKKIYYINQPGAISILFEPEYLSIINTYTKTEFSNIYEDVVKIKLSLDGIGATDYDNINDAARACDVSSSVGFVKYGDKFYVVEKYILGGTAEMDFYKKRYYHMELQSAIPIKKVNYIDKQSIDKITTKYRIDENIIKFTDIQEALKVSNLIQGNTYIIQYSNPVYFIVGKFIGNDKDLTVNEKCTMYIKHPLNLKNLPLLPAVEDKSFSLITNLLIETYDQVPYNMPILSLDKIEIIKYLMVHNVLNPIYSSEIDANNSCSKIPNCTGYQKMTIGNQELYSLRTGNILRKNDDVRAILKYNNYKNFEQITDIKLPWYDIPP